MVCSYVAYREARDAAALEHLNEAATLLADAPRLRGRSFDVLGMLLSRQGDLDGAHDIFALSVELMRANLAGAEPHSLALTYGNLGRLELSLGQFAEAESWLRQKILQSFLLTIRRPPPRRTFATSWRRPWTGRGWSEQPTCVQSSSGRAVSRHEAP